MVNSLTLFVIGKAGTTMRELCRYMRMIFSSFQLFGVVAVLALAQA